MNPPSKRQRIAVGCQNCKDRHLKCDDGDPCRQCLSQGCDCIRSANIRFRSSASDQTSNFPINQEWVTPTSAVRYHDETTEIAQHYEHTKWQARAPVGTFISYFDNNEPAHNLTSNSEHASIITNTATETRPFRSPTQVLRSSRATSTQNSPRYSSKPSGPSPRQSIPSPLTDESPASLTSYLSEYQLRPSSQVVPVSDREAELIRNFVENMALWADITDIRRHFEIEVPRRALFNPTIRYAICAFSSRHMNRNETGNTAESLNYHNKCLERLIPILSNLDHDLTEDILAAVAILRLDEEMETGDNGFHLQGITRILDQVSFFCWGGGLGEATAWLCLRQEIYVSLVTQQPLRTKAANFEKSSAFRENDDLSWANRIVLLLAQVLSTAFLDPSMENTARLKELERRVEAWMQDKPASFEPIKFVPGGPDTAHRFPIIWMLQPFHVLGIQYYHIAKIVLVVSADQADISKRYFFRWSKDVERRVRKHILTIVGLAKSNPKAENTLFTARHTLTVWGNTLTKPADQEAVKGFLHDMEQRTGWKNSNLISHLTEQWEDSDDN